ncbi:hypothetical protein HC028_01435 [Planosporangium flavigriseum]|uniref:Uncharacterized protein n=1 Tax=Planosporangium flavigriseum TaxID=373681 RepID=A0A8J3PJM7_9ACTN|nr:hypothetical protein [Planosporangium flavigriseum]NJC63179.1 hypothetical protein [Planosporangium flavigriseum]GIG72451.1 hypothetical protein Pfl04_08550 [Planosporangium flavigriseum]
MSKRYVQHYPVEEYEGDYDVYGDHGDDEYVEPEPVRRTAPASVHLVAIIGYVAGLALLAAGVAAVVYALGGHRYLEGQFAVDLSAVTGAGIAVGALLVFAALFTLAISRKLQRGRRWVRVLVLLLAAASIAHTLYTGLFAVGGSNVLLGLVLPVIYVVLLNTSAARSWFRRHTY